MSTLLFNLTIIFVIIILLICYVFCSLLKEICNTFCYSSTIIEDRTISKTEPPSPSQNMEI